VSLLEAGCRRLFIRDPAFITTKLPASVPGIPHAVMFYKRVPYLQRYLVVGLVGLGLLLTVAIRVSRVSIMVSVRVSVK